MQRRTNRAAKKRDRWIGLFVVELVRATHNGELPVTRQDLIAVLKRKYRLSLQQSLAYELIRDLLSGGPDRSRVWLRTEGHDVYLHSEEATITNSDAIDALFVASELLRGDGDDRVDYEVWVAECRSRSGFTREMCERFVDEYLACGYAIALVEHEGGGRSLELNPRNFNRDAFYLKPAREAGLRRRPG